MSVDLIRYDLLVQDALRGVVRRVLIDVAEDGLPGEHHLYISFDTCAPGVRLSPRLKERYPEEMTIVLQHQFWDLVVTDAFFEVGLSFNGIPERLHVPFAALKGFFDPSVKFGLQFEPSGVEEDEEDEAPAPASAPAAIGPRPVSVPTTRSEPTPLRPAPAAEEKRESKADKPATEARPRAARDDARVVRPAADVAPAEDKTETAREGRGAAERKGAAEGRKPAPEAADDAAKPDAGAQVVRLDSFRKK